MPPLQSCHVFSQRLVAFKDPAKKMAREYYQCLFALEGKEQLLLWYSDERDGVFVDSRGVVPTFLCVEELNSYAKTVGLSIQRQAPISHDLDAVHEFVAKDGGDDFDCNHMLAAWNLFGDVARSVGDPGSEFLKSDHSMSAIYDKIFHGCNLPSITADEERYIPSWSPDEIAAIRDFTKIGLLMFDRAMDAATNQGAGRDIPPNR